MSRRLFLSALLSAGLVLAPPMASGQTLARPGWAGSGMSIESWWTHAVLYEIDPHGYASHTHGSTGDLRGIVDHLEYIRSLGVEGIVLTNFAPAQGDPVARYQSIDPSLGTLNDVDELIRETSRDGMRLIIQLDPQQIHNPADLVTVGRFWLNRGVGGLSIASVSPTNMDPAEHATLIKSLRDLTRSVPGHRILIDQASEAVPNLNKTQQANLSLNPTLAQLPSLDAARVRAAIQTLESGSKAVNLLSATDGFGLPRSASRFGDGTHDVAIAQVMATLLLSTRSNAQLYFGQEIGLGDKPASALMPWGATPDPAKTKPAATTPEVAAEEANSGSLLNWYRHLMDLHHGNATLRSGTIQLLNHDDQNAVVWITRRSTVSFHIPAIFVICSLSPQPMTLSLTKDIHDLHLRGNFLRPVLRSDNGMGGVDVNAIPLQPYGVYIGELLY